MACEDIFFFSKKNDKSRREIPSVSAWKVDEDEEALLAQIVRSEVSTAADAAEGNTEQKSVDANFTGLSGDTAALKKNEIWNSGERCQLTDGLVRLSLEVNQVMELEGGQCYGGEDKCVFKTPQKRRMKESK